jgi:hypothetical protein
MMIVKEQQNVSLMIRLIKKNRNGAIQSQFVMKAKKMNKPKWTIFKNFSKAKLKIIIFFMKTEISPNIAPDHAMVQRISNYSETKVHIYSHKREDGVHTEYQR